MQRATDWRFLQHLAAAQRRPLLLRVRRRAGAGRRRTSAAPDVDGTPQPDVVLLQDGQLPELGRPAARRDRAGDDDGGGARPDRQADRARRRHARARRCSATTTRRPRSRPGSRRPGRPRRWRSLRDPFPLDEAIGAETTAATDEARFVIELRAELDPSLYRGLLRARRPVLVRGVGRRFSGVYYVQSVRTTLEGATLLQTLRRDAQRDGPDRPGELRPVRGGGAGAVSEPYGERVGALVGRPLLRQVRGRRHRRRRPEEDRPHPREGAGGARRGGRQRLGAALRAGRRRQGARDAVPARRSATRSGSSSPPATSAARSGSGRSGARPTAPAARTTSAARPGPRRRRATRQGRDADARRPEDEERPRADVRRRRRGRPARERQRQELDPLRAGRRGRRSPPRRSSSARRPTEKVVLGDTFMQFFNTHTHPTGVGPSGPPVQPMAASHLSAKVTTE